MIAVYTTKVFKSGNSQAVRIPKEYQVDDDELFINKVANALILIPKKDPWALFKQSLTEFPEDFFADGRNQPEDQKRPALDELFK
jgi:antitoxin VapB